jgi:hypothetical protein
MPPLSDAILVPSVLEMYRIAGLGCCILVFVAGLKLAAELIVWMAHWLRFLGKTLWIVAFGAYANRPFVKAAVAASVVLVSRLRKDAAFWSVPQSPRPFQPKKRGPKPMFGEQGSSLAKRAAHRHDWQTTQVVL